jgi:hypothetical protein
MAEELIDLIREEQPNAEGHLKVWRGGEQVIGSFGWDDAGLGVSCAPLDDEECPNLWSWEAEIDVMAETIQMRVSPVHASADVLREGKMSGVAIRCVNGSFGGQSVHHWKQNVVMV